MAQDVTAYFLSCKRFNLFEKTFKSFWENCKDLDLISSIIVIDDNSSNEDRKNIEKLLSEKNIPSLFVCKNAYKGQANSLNLVYDLCKTKYAFAIEDDWMFFRPGNFLRYGFEILNKHDHIKRVCVDLSSSGKNLDNIQKQDIYQCENGVKYFLDEYRDKNQWPSFTFRQSLIDIKDCFSNIGYVNSVPKLSHDVSPATAETDYAVRYCNFGYRTAFLIDSFVTEISGGGPSSFSLNNVNRHKEI